VSRSKRGYRCETSYFLTGYPPVGAWQFLHHLRATDMTDSGAVDILWFRLARRTDNASLLVPLMLALLAAAFAWKAIRVEQASKAAPVGLGTKDAARAST
jgi:hypothetical protein